MFDLIGADRRHRPDRRNLGVLLTGLLLGIRHGIDWDHIAAITDITSTTAAAGMADAAHVEQHREISGHAPRPRRRRSRSAPTTRARAARLSRPPSPRARRGPRRASAVRSRATRSDSGRSTRSATAPSSSPSAWPPSRSARSCRTGSIRSWAGSSASPSSPSACGSCTRSTATRAPASGSGCGAAGCSCSTAIRYGWRRFQARLHGHEHVEPLEMSSYGARTSFGVGMIHGIGAETGTPGPAHRRRRWRVERRASACRCCSRS